VTETFGAGPIAFATVLRRTETLPVRKSRAPRPSHGHPRLLQMQQSRNAPFELPNRRTGSTRRPPWRLIRQWPETATRRPNGFEHHLAHLPDSGEGP